MGGNVYQRLSETIKYTFEDFGSMIEHLFNFLMFQSPITGLNSILDTTAFIHKVVTCSK